MLTTLRIKNLALVADLTLELRPGCNVITGETGAGKSIIIGALNLVLGERADRTLIRAGVRVLVGLLLPAAVLFVAAPSAASALTGNFSDLGSSPAVLRGFGVGLVAFSVYLFLLRGFYAMQDTRTPFIINAMQNGANVVLAVVLAAMIFFTHRANIARLRAGAESRIGQQT